MPSISRAAPPTPGRANQRGRDLAWMTGGNAARRARGPQPIARDRGRAREPGRGAAAAWRLRVVGARGGRHARAGAWLHRVRDRARRDHGGSRRARRAGARPAPSRARGFHGRRRGARERSRFAVGASRSRPAPAHRDPVFTPRPRKANGSRW
jgi:hypothetical protein